MNRVSRDSRRAVVQMLAAWGLAAASAVAAPRLRAAGTGAPANPARFQPDAHSALLIVDVQNCFVSGGTLAVPHGEDVVPVINRLVGAFDTVVATQDWHTSTPA